MYAVIVTGGKQYRVKKGDVLSVEKLQVEKGQKVDFDQVLLIEDGKKIRVGTPVLEDAVVRAEVIETFKDEKVIVFKKKRRKQYRRTKGHRQELTKIQVEGIFSGKGSLPPEEKKKEKEIPVKAEAPEKKPEKKSKARAEAGGKKEAGETGAPKKKAEIEKKAKKKPAPKKPAAKPAAKKKAATKE